MTTTIESRKSFIRRYLILLILTFQIASCIGQVKEKTNKDARGNEINTQPILSSEEESELRAAEADAIPHWARTIQLHVCLEQQRCCFLFSGTLSIRHKRIG